MVKDIFQISVPILVAIVSSLVAYLKAVKDSKLKMVFAFFSISVSPLKKESTRSVCFCDL